MIIELLTGLASVETNRCQSLPEMLKDYLKENKAFPLAYAGEPWNQRITTRVAALAARCTSNRQLKRPHMPEVHKVIRTFPV